MFGLRVGGDLQEGECPRCSEVGLVLNRFLLSRLNIIRVFVGMIWLFDWLFILLRGYLVCGCFGD